MRRQRLEGATRDVLLPTLAGVAALLAAFPLAAYLAGEALSPGAAGFCVIFALPGLALQAYATGALEPLRLAPLLPLGFVLLGLDVTDSDRRVVAIGGYVAAGVGAVAALATALLLHRRASAAP
jgi:hypothetical protein